MFGHTLTNFLVGNCEIDKNTMFDDADSIMNKIYAVLDYRTLEYNSN